jgi:hypothetical protein
MPGAKAEEEGQDTEGQPVAPTVTHLPLTSFTYQGMMTNPFRIYFHLQMIFAVDVKVR